MMMLLIFWWMYQMFSSEKEFVDILQEVLRSTALFKTEDQLSEYLILNEVNLGFGIADIVVTSRKKCNYRKPLDSIDIHLLSCIKRESGRTVLSLVNDTGIAKSSVKNSIGKLIELNLVKNIDDKYHIDQEYEFGFDYVVAIEVKLRDWKRALKQAYRYKWFSDRSYVCLPDDSSFSAKKNISEFVEYGIGLLTFHDNGKIERVYEPPVSTPVEPKMTMLLNEQILSIPSH